MDYNINFFVLKGQTIISLSQDLDRIETDKGIYSVNHHQDCCESVCHIKTIGDYKSLIGKQITLAEDDRFEDDPDWYKEDKSYRDSYTWSKYVLEAEDGNEKVRVEFYYLGESNGYYGETMSFDKLN